MEWQPANNEARHQRSAHDRHSSSILVRLRRCSSVSGYSRTSAVCLRDAHDAADTCGSHTSCGKP